MTVPLSPTTRLVLDEAGILAATDPAAFEEKLERLQSAAQSARGPFAAQARWVARAIERARNEFLRDCDEPCLPGIEEVA